MRQWAVVALATLSGCAALPQDIEPAPVSTAKFQSYTCEQLAADISLFEPQLYELALDQTEARRFDQGAILAFGISPTMIGQGRLRDSKISDLRGDLAAMRSEGARKNCTLPAENPRLQDALAGKVWRTPVEQAERDKRR